MDDFERWRGVVRDLTTYGLHMVHVLATKVICHSLIFFNCQVCNAKDAILSLSRNR